MYAEGISCRDDLALSSLVADRLAKYNYAVEKVTDFKNEEKQKNLDFRRFISQFIHAMKTPVTVIDLAVQNTPGTVCQDRRECGLYNTIQDISEENKRQLEMLNNWNRVEKFQIRDSQIYCLFSVQYLHHIYFVHFLQSFLQ